MALDAWDPDGRPVRGRVGELVVTEPMPSMPSSLWDDPDGERYQSSYFDIYPGVWRHGRAAIVAAIRRDASPAHVPDEVIQMPTIPRTLTGKKLEIPVKRILQGARPADVVDPGTVDPPGGLQRFAHAKSAGHLWLMEPAAERAAFAPASHASALAPDELFEQLGDSTVDVVIECSGNAAATSAVLRTLAPGGSSETWHHNGVSFHPAAGAATA